jgi:hypothetical protein
MARWYSLGGLVSGQRVACDLPIGGLDQYEQLLAISKETTYGKYIV